MYNDVLLAMANMNRVTMVHYLQKVGPPEEKFGKHWYRPGPRFPIMMDPRSYDPSYESSFERSLFFPVRFPKLLLT